MKSPNAKAANSTVRSPCSSTARRSNSPVVPTRQHCKYARAERLGKAIEKSSEMHYWITRLRFYALSQLGHLSLSNHNNITAATHYEQARSVGRSFDWYERLPDGTKELQPHRIHKGVVENNLALALAQSPRAKHAPAVAAAALKRDPANPVFTETLAYAEATTGDTCKPSRPMTLHLPETRRCSAQRAIEVCCSRSRVNSKKPSDRFVTPLRSTPNSQPAGPTLAGH